MGGKCPSCGAPLEGNSCAYCGYEAKSTVVTCEVKQQTEVTYNTNAASAAPKVSEKSKSVALILCVFLGYLGIHWFYVGKPGKGLLYMFTGGLVLVGWITDIIRILSGSFTDKFGLPLKN